MAYYGHLFHLQHLCTNTEEEISRQKSLPNLRKLNIYSVKKFESHLYFYLYHVRLGLKWINLQT